VGTPACSRRSAALLLLLLLLLLPLLLLLSGPEVCWPAPPPASELPVSLSR
jgi:hypothetical protein